MGGIIIFTAIAVPFLLLTDRDARSLTVFGVAVACALLGFADDYTKLVKRRSLGLRGRTKLIVTALIAIGLWLGASEGAELGDTLNLRIVDAQIDLGYLYPVLIYFVVAGTTSAVNLTDGLDGLAAGCAAIVLLAYIAIAFISRDADLALVAGCLVGACVGFLWFNSFPASIFMGDTGSLGLGGAIAAMAVMTTDRGAADHPRRHLRDRGAVGPDPGLLLPDLPQARVPDGADPPPLRAPGVVGDEDHPALLDRRLGLRGDRLHALPAVGRMSRRLVSSGSTYERDIGFSRAVRDGDRVWVSATAAISPDGSVDPDAARQAERCLEIISAALREAGASLADVVRTRVFLVDAADGPAVGEVHGRVFGDVRPASGFIVVSGFLDPRWRVEIEADAVVA